MAESDQVTLDTEQEQMEMFNEQINQEADQEVVESEQNSTVPEPVSETNPDSSVAATDSVAEGENNANVAEPNTEDTTPQETDSSTDDERKLFIGGLSWNTTKEDMQKYFEKFGQVKDCILKEENGRSRGFGFVTFISVEAREKVLNETHTLDGRTIEAKRAEKRDFQQKNKKIFVGGLDPELSEEEVKAYFGSFGEIEVLDLPKDRSTDSRRAFAFITYSTEEAARKACEKPRITLGKRDCDIKLAGPSSKAGFGGKGGYNQGWGGGYSQGYGPYGGYGGYGGGYGGYGGYYDQYQGWGGDYSSQYGGGYGYGAGYGGYWGDGYSQQQQASSYGKSARGGARGGYHPYQR